ncbi:TolC family protein [Stutzerimonas stutzeri]|uniref:Outer membrane protein TolC n=2 Tax=Pseudomonadota TaxID=1224 RepID=A0A5S5BJB5_STUST|nr:TolC family protein [Stutzerimonas stutzeri]TYP67157.1 outer membrane protein TolC [Stutzerimonas stutzeri]
MKRALGLSLGAVLLLSACADTVTMSKARGERAGFETVAGISRQATGAEAAWLQTPAERQAHAQRVRAIVQGKTISAEQAVQVALLNNPGLQASYADLGMSAADLWETALGPVPSVGISVSGLVSGDVTRSVEGTVASSILDMVTKKSRTRAADLEFRQAQLAAAGETLALAHETRRTWIEAVGAFEAAGLVGRAQGAADAASELAAELGETGALSRADQAREHAFNAELAAERAEARLEAQIAKEKLVRLLGLWGTGTEFYVPDSLPALPGSAPNRSNIERLALENRVDLAAGRLELEAVAARYRLTGQTRMLSDAEVAAGVEIEREDGENERSPVVDVAFSIPVYDTSGLISRRGKLEYLRSANNLAQSAINARSEARSAYSAVTGKHQIALHWRDQVLPLRREIDEQALLSYNGMLTSTFELLNDAREGLDSQLSAAEAKRDYWLAEADATAAIWGGASDNGEDE